jgi:Ion channel
MYTEILHNILLGLAIILTTFVVHAYSLDRLITIVTRLLPLTRPPHRSLHFWQVSILLLTALGIITIHSIEIWIWALVYLAFDIQAVGNLETALYFSTVSFTTVGYGDVVLDPSWRLLGAMQAASGMILFGWSTAFIFEVLAITYRQFNIRNLRIDRD